jgi:hypothetical protein
MFKSVMPRVALVGLFATGIMPSASTPAHAAADCLPGPDRSPPPGGHWYYHLDRVNDRKCWYLLGPASQAPGQPPMPDAPEPQPSAAAATAPQTTLGTFFSSWSSGFTGLTAAIPPDPGGDARVSPTAAAGDPNGDGTAAIRQPRIVRHPDADAALTPKSHRPAHVQPRTEQAQERPAPALDQDERDALFQEFLRWRDRRPAQP